MRRLYWVIPIMAVAGLCGWWFVRQHANNAPPDPRIVALARANIEQVLRDPDFLPGCRLRATPKPPDHIPGSPSEIEFDVVVPTTWSAQGLSSVGTAYADGKTGALTALFLMSLSDQGQNPAARSGSDNPQATLAVARRFWKRQYPQLWTQADSVEEEMGAGECHFTGVKSGFKAYGSASAVVLMPESKVIECIKRVPDIEPPQVRVPEQQAGERAAQYLRRQRIAPGPITATSRWLGSAGGSKRFRGLWHINLKGSYGQEAWRYSADVDVVNGRVYNLDGHPESEFAPPSSP